LFDEKSQWWYRQNPGTTNCQQQCNN